RLSSFFSNSTGASVLDPLSLHDALPISKIGREIVIAVKQGGPNPDSNPRLRAVMQNAKALNMPKTNVEAAIKRASDKDTSNYDQDRKSTRLNSSHVKISYAVFCLKKKNS